MRRLRLTPRRIAVLLAATVGVGAGIAYAATLTVGSWHLWAGSQTLTKATCTLQPATADTYVTQATPGGSNGGTATMLVRSNSGGADWAFVQFDLTSCPIPIPANGGADTATLTLVITTKPSSRTITVAPVLTNWSTALTWTAAQSLSYGSPTTTFATGSKTATIPVTVTADVDALIRNPSASFGWRLSDTGTGNATTTFASSQNGTSTDRPKLVINYEY